MQPDEVTVYQVLFCDLICRSLLGCVGFVVAAKARRKAGFLGGVYIARLDLGSGS